MDRNSIGHFFDQWAIYDKVVSNDYMHHQYFTRIIRPYLTSLSRPIQVLDLGCGDARLIAELSGDLSIGGYYGCDLSEQALQLARGRLLEAGISPRLFQKDMSDMVLTVSSCYDLIFSGYSMHHLDDNEKWALLKQLESRLDHDGLLIVMDVFRMEGQSREAYLDSYLAMIRQQWQLLSEVEFDLIRSHIESSDYPATTGDFENWLIRLSYKLQGIYAPDPWHRMYVAKRA